MKAVVDHPFASRPRRPVAAVAAVLILLFLGASLVAVREIPGRCETARACLELNRGGCLLLNTGARLLLYEGQTTRCELSAWSVQIPLSARAADILRRLGVRFVYS
jgi:hypothetical protein